MLCNGSIGGTPFRLIQVQHATACVHWGALKGRLSLLGVIQHTYVLTQFSNTYQHMRTPWQVQWVENERGQIIIDRAFNTQKLMSFYMDREINPNDIEWNPLDPNSLKLRLPGESLTATYLGWRPQVGSELPVSTEYQLLEV